MFIHNHIRIWINLSRWILGNGFRTVAIIRMTSSAARESSPRVLKFMGHGHSVGEERPRFKPTCRQDGQLCTSKSVVSDSVVSHAVHQ